MRPPVRPPRLRCVLFPSMHLPHLLVLPTTFGLQCLLPPYPHFRALYAVPVRQVRGLLTASFRFHLTMDTLAVRLCTSSLSTRTRDFHPLENAHAGQTKLAGCVIRILPIFFRTFMYNKTAITITVTIMAVIYLILSYFIFLIGGSSVILLVPYLYSFCFYIIYFRGYYNIYNCFHHSQCPYHLSMIVLSYSFYNLSFI